MNYKLLTSQFNTEDYSLVQKIFANRNIHSKDIEHYLNTTEDDVLDPKLIANIEDGVKILIKHIYAENDVLLVVDPDADGFTSSALLLNYLNCLFPAFVQNHVSYVLHEGKEHGIIMDAISDNIKLVLLPDSSSNEYEKHELLHKRGIDIIIIDHHEADKVSEYACVINNQLCDYPTKSLSGVGMVYKFCSLIDSLLGVKYVDTYIDLAALGIIGDVMDIRNYETKYIISAGIKNIQNPFITSMVEMQEYSISKHGGLDPFSVAFYIVPQVNAVIRVGTQEEKTLLFESMLDFKGYDLIPSTKRGCKGQMELRAEQACRTCSNVKNKQTKMRDEALEFIETLIEENNLLDNKILLIQIPVELEVNKNLTGLIANQLMGKYQRPVLLLNQTEIDGEIAWAGSGRGYDKSELTDTKEFLTNSGFMVYAQGHPQAMGCSILDTNIQPFLDYSNEKLKDYDFTPCYKVDAVLNANNFNSQDIIRIADLKSVWGQGISEPLLILEHITITKDNLTLMSPDKSPTLKIRLPNGTSLIKFKASQEEFEDLYSATGCVIINAVGKCEKNEWNGTITPQIIIEDYEIVNKMAYYF